MLRRTLAVARAEWIHNYRDVRSLIVIAILPIALLLIYGYGISYDLDNIPFGVYDLDGGATARSLIEQFRANRYFKLREAVTDRHRVDWLLDRGEVVFVLVIPPDMGRVLGAGRQATVQVLADGADTTRANVALGYIDAALADFSGKLTADYMLRQGVTASPPLVVLPTILYNPGLKSVRFIVPGLIALLLTLLAALLTSTCVVRERESGSFESLVASPTRAHEIMLGKLIPYVVMAFADIVLCIVAGRLIFGVAPAGSHGLLLVASVIFLVVSLAIGLLFSVVAHTQQFAILMAMLVTLLPTTLLSGFAFPVRNMPLFLQGIAQLFPATHFIVIIRAIYMKGSGIGELWHEVAILIAFTLALIALAVRRFRKRL